MAHGSTHCDCHSPNYRVLYEQWFVRTFEWKVARKVAMVAFVVVVALCIKSPLGEEVACERSNHRVSKFGFSDLK